MKTQKSLLVLASVMSVLLYGEQSARAQGAAVPVHVVITDAALQGNSTPPRLDMSAVKVKQGKNYLKVTQVVPARGDAATLQLFILIDDTLNTSIGNHLQELKDFVNAQPASTIVGVGYMSNAGCQRRSELHLRITTQPSMRSVCRVAIFQRWTVRIYR